MWPTTSAFNDALLASSRHWYSKVEVLYGGAVVTTLDVVTDGDVDIDDVAVRRELSLTMVDAEGVLTPADAKDLLAPKGTEIRVYRGLDVSRHGGSGIEYVPLGVFGLVKPEVTSHGPGTTIKVKAFDRVDAVRKRRFTEPWAVAAGTATHEAITSIVSSRITAPARITVTGNTTPEIVFDALSDPWDAVRKIAEADGISTYFDPLGTHVVAPAAEHDTGITYAPGEQGLLIDVKRIIDADVTYSGVIVTGEHPDQDPIRYTLWDEDPRSPTYHLGDFGERPYGFSSPLITTMDQAMAAAETILARVTRMRQQVQITTVGHPGHDVGDVVTINDPASRTSGRYALTGGKIPLRPGLITLKAREVVES